MMELRRRNLNSRAITNRASSLPSVHPQDVVSNNNPKSRRNTVLLQAKSTDDKGGVRGVSEVKKPKVEEMEELNHV